MIWIIRFNEAGDATSRTCLNTDKLPDAKPYTYVTNDEQLGKVSIVGMTASIDPLTGKILNIEEPITTPELWLHGSIDGGTVNQLTGTRYIERGQILTYSASLRASSDPASAVVTHIPGSDPPEALSGEWALELMHEDGLDQFCPMVQMTEGNISGSVTIPDRLCDGLYQLPEERMAMVGPFKLRVANPAAFEFKIRS